MTFTRAKRYSDSRNLLASESESRNREIVTANPMDEKAI